MNEKIKWSMFKKEKKAIVNPPKTDQQTQTENVDSYEKWLLFKKLPLYSKPSEQDFNAYLNILDHHFNVLQIPEGEKVSYLITCIRQEARENLLKAGITIDKNASWNQAIEQLKSLFYPKDITIQQLRNVQQRKHQSFEDFIAEIQALVEPLFPSKNGYTAEEREMETVRYFVRGTLKPIKQKLKGNYFRSINDVLKMANQIHDNGATEPSSNG